jgi:uncharacterized zinc-type alcohol dehydrogenase-like protein
LRFGAVACDDNAINALIDPFDAAQPRPAPMPVRPAPDCILDAQASLLRRPRSLPMPAVKAYATASATSALAPFAIERREPGPHDVHLDILYCGVCHSDLHQARNDWSNSIYPMVPGHEIVGRVVKVGSAVDKLRLGEYAGVGCMVDSCRQCESCVQGLEQYCDQGPTLTYNDRERGSERPTFGGYSEQIVVDERFVVRIPGSLDLKAVAPLLCAGITTYSPLRHWKVGAGQRVGVIGLGGLGHLGIKFAKALGAHVVMITTSAHKAADATRLGADEVLLSRDAAAMHRYAGSFDFLLNTIPNGHDLNPYAALLRRDATMTLVGALTALEPALAGFSLIGGRRAIAGSAIGGMPETQEMIDFCAAHRILSDVEVVRIQDINAAYERLLRGDVRYRFVIDMASLRERT